MTLALIDRKDASDGLSFEADVANPAAKGQRPLIQNAGFSKTMKRGFDGVVRERS